MLRRSVFTQVLVTTLVASAAAGAAMAQSSDGLIRVRSAYSTDETIQRLKADIAAKGIRFFDEIDQADLAAKAGVKLPLRRSTLLVFGNPPLGTQFINGKPEAGIDWPVRLLVQEDAQGNVTATYTDFAWIARRHGVTGDAPFRTATGVIASITSSVAAK
jgi:uncharacterized protein (DUF302 family)